MEFKETLEMFKKTCFEEQVFSIKSSIRKDFKDQIGHMVGLLSNLITEPKSCIIPVDKDFDGYASARVKYHLLTSLGINSYNIEFVYLNSSHAYKFEETLRDKYIFITDTEYGNVTFKKLENCVVTWIDHHNTARMKQLKALSTLSSKNGTYLNSRSSQDKLVNNLSCGMLTLLFCECALEDLEIDKDLKQVLINKLNSECYLDSSLSLISDEMPTELYSGILKHTYVCTKTDMYNSLKRIFDHDNKKYFKSYIAKINNIIRMNNSELLDNLLRNTTGHNILSEIERLESDKKMIMNNYFKKCRPCYSYKDSETKGVIEFYKLPFSQNETFRNFKGMLASSKIPKVNNKPFIIFSYYASNGIINLSCRTNQDINLRELISSNVEIVDSGGHKMSFGIKIKEQHLESLYEYCKTINLQIPENRCLNTKENLMSSELLKSIAYYNEFSRELITLEFPKEQFSDVVVEPKRVLYYLKLSDCKEPIKVVSFGNSEGNFIHAKPRLRSNIKELDFIEICE